MRTRAQRLAGVDGRGKTLRRPAVFSSPLGSSPLCRTSLRGVASSRLLIHRADTRAATLVTKDVANEGQVLRLTRTTTVMVGGTEEGAEILVMVATSLVPRGDGPSR
jgi:hypothetical protein